MVSRQMRLYDGVALRIERNGTDRRPVTGVARPTCGSALAGLAVQGMSSGQNFMIRPVVSLSRADITNAAMAVIDVVPMHEPNCPSTSLVEIGEALSWELWPVLGRTKQRFGVGIVIAHAGPGVRGLDAQPVEHRQHRRGLKRGAVVAMQNGLGAHHGDSFGQRSAAHQVRGMISMVVFVYFPAHNLAAVEIENQVKVEPASHHLSRQVRHIPAPNLPRLRGNVRRRRPDGLGRLCTSAVSGLPMILQHATEGRFAGQVDAFVGQHGHDAGWWHSGKARLIGHGKYLRTLDLAQRMAGCRAHSLRPPIAPDDAVKRFPSLQGAQLYPSRLASKSEPRAGRMRGVNISGQRLERWSGKTEQDESERAALH